MRIPRITLPVAAGLAAGVVGVSWLLGKMSGQTIFTRLDDLTALLKNYDARPAQHPNLRMWYLTNRVVSDGRGAPALDIIRQIQKRDEVALVPCRIEDQGSSSVLLTLPRTPDWRSKIPSGYCDLPPL